MPAPTLQTPRLTLRAILPEDRPALTAILADPVAMEHMHYRHWNEAQRERWVDMALEIAAQPDADSVLWIIELTETGDVIGWFGMGNPARPDLAGDLSFEDVLARSHWNQGLMTEAMRAVFAHAFDALGVPRINANCHPANGGSARVMEKAGMRFLYAKSAPDQEGTWREQRYFRITRADWGASAR